MADISKQQVTDTETAEIMNEAFRAITTMYDAFTWTPFLSTCLIGVSLAVHDDCIVSLTYEPKNKHHEDLWIVEVALRQLTEKRVEDDPLDAIGFCFGAISTSIANHGELLSEVLDSNGLCFREPEPKDQEHEETAGEESAG